MTTSIQELFDRDPLELSKKDIDEIIAYHRAHRHTFTQTGKAPTKKAAEKLLPELDFDL